MVNNPFSKFKTITFVCVFLPKKLTAIQNKQEAMEHAIVDTYEEKQKLSWMVLAPRHLA